MDLIRVQGWVRTRRDSKDFSFIELNDGSTLRNLQIIAKNTLPNENFARECLQLFSIGIQALNVDGTAPPGGDSIVWDGFALLVDWFAFPLLFMVVSSLKPDTDIFRDIGSLRAFLIMDTRARAVDRLRRDGARRRREERDAQTQTPAYDDDLEVWDRLLATHLRDALDVLTQDERSAIELAFFGGHTYRDVAVLLGEPEGTVKSRIRSGLHRLRGQLVKQGISGSWLDN